MLVLNRLRNSPDTGRVRGSKLISALALLTVCLIAANPLLSTASENSKELTKKATTTKLKASATTIGEHQKLTLTATVSPSKSTGTVKFYGTRLSDGEHKVLGSSKVAGGVAKLSGFIGVTGSFKFDAVYGGSSKYDPSTSNSVTVVSKKN